MSLLDSIEDDKKKLAELDAAQAQAPATEPKPEAPEPEPQDQPEPAPADEPAAEEPADQKPKEDLGSAGYARLRMESAAAKRKADALEAELAQLRAQKEKPASHQEAKPDTDAEPDKAADREAWLDWRDRQIDKKQAAIDARLDGTAKTLQEIERERTYGQAVQEFVSLEQEFKASVPDYDKAAGHMRQRLADSLIALNPSLTPAQAQKLTTDRILHMASQAVNNGYNPIEYLYLMAKDTYGFKEEPAAPAKADGPDLDKIAQNKKRAASPLSAGGKSGSARVTAESIIDMPLSKFKQLSREEKQAAIASA